MRVHGGEQPIDLESSPCRRSMFTLGQPVNVMLRSMRLRVYLVVALVGYVACAMTVTSMLVASLRAGH